jgi:uncharacterized protein (TIGR02147 family)
MNLFSQDNYKEAIRLWIRDQKGTDRGVFKNLADYLGVSPAVVSQVMSGDRDFTEEQIFSICEYLGVPELESQYLLTLLKIERAGTVKLKNHYIQQRDQLRKQTDQLKRQITRAHVLSDSDKAIYYSSYLYFIIHSAARLENVTFDFICRKFTIAPEHARKILDFLLKCGLITEKDGRYFPGVNLVYVDDDSPFRNSYLKNARLLGTQTIERRTSDDLFLSSFVIINQEDFIKFKEELDLFFQKFLVAAQKSTPKQIVNLNIDLFKIKT